MGSIGKIIKVYLPQYIIDIIKKDIDSFNIKRNGKENLSGFCNLLFGNLKDHIFIENEEMKKKFEKEILDKKLKRSMKELNITDELISSIKYSLLKNFSDLLNDIRNLKKKTYSDFITFRLNLENSQYFEEVVLAKLPVDITMSDYFRILFAEYVSKPQYIRERTIFSSIYEKLKEAVKQRIKVKIKLKDRSTYYTSIPCLLNNSREEQYNYLILLDEERNIRSIRLSHIDEIILLIQSEYILTDYEKESLKRLEDNFDPFTFNVSKIKLCLTEQGENLYKRIVHNRPDYLRKEKNEYIFNCSKDRIFVYFFSFGSEVEVLEPEDLRERFRISYKNALEIYSS